MAVTLSLFAGAGAQFFDNSGNVLTGGKIYTYQAGTTTPLAVYTTNSGSTFHTNPIILDAAGRVPSGGEIWLQLGVGYKFVLKTSTEVLIATYDNIPSSAQPPAANDANSIMYEQGYTVTAGSFAVGSTYRILSVGTTNFTLIGAAANTVGTHFIATGVGTGTGTAEYSQTVEAKLQQTVTIADTRSNALPVMAQINGITNAGVTGSSANTSLQLSGYHSVNDGGGGLFYWDSTKSKADHNGGTIVDPTAPFPADWDNQTQLAAWFDSNNAGTGCWIRQFAGAVNVKWFGAYADASKTPSNVLAFQRTFDFAYGNVLVPDANIYEVELGEGNFWINGPVGFPTSNLQGRGFMVLKGRGGIITVAEDTLGIGEAIFTSLRSIPTPDSTADLFTGNIVIDDILFVGDIATGGKPVVFNGDRLYNIEIKSCKFYEIYMVARSFRNKGPGFAQGYFQSLYIHHCHFARCGFIGVDEYGGILHGFSSYNVRVLENFGEGSLGYFVHLNGGASRSFSMFNNIWESGGMILDATNIEGQLVGTYSEANIGATVTAAKAFVRLQEIAANTRPNNFVLEANNFYLSDAQTSDSDFYPIKVAGSPITGNHHKIRVLSNSISSPAPQTKGLVQTLNGRIAEYIGNSVGQVGDNNTVFSIKNFSFEKTTVISLTGSSTTTLRFTFQGAGSFKIRVSAVTGYAASGAVFEFNVFGQFTSTPLIATVYSNSVPASGTGAVTLGSITGGVGYIDIPFITTGGDDRRAFVEITGAGSSSILTTGAALDFTGNPDIANVVRL